METKRKVMHFEVKQVGESEDRVLRFIGSDETPDRDDDIIEVSGWQLDDYKKNPVFLWAHRYDIPPIGKAVNVFRENGKLMFDIQFPKLTDLSTDIKNPSEHAKFVDTIYNLYKNRYLNATSVGFDPIEYKARDDEESMKLPEWQRGMRFIKQSLLELSAVPVPANPNAIQLAKQKGYDVQPLIDWAEKTLKETDPDGMWVSKEVAKSIKKSLEQKEGKILSEARVPEYEGTETTSWGEVDKTFEAYRDGYYNHTGDEPESDEDRPQTVGDAPQPMKDWIAQKTLLGDPNAEDVANLIFFPVVNPETNQLNEGALRAVISGRGQEADIPEEVYESANRVARELLENEFDMGEERGKLAATIKIDPEELAKHLIKEMQNQQKAGRVISASNEDRLRTAISMLEEILEQIEDSPLEDDEMNLLEDAKGIFNKLDAAIKGQTGNDEPYIVLADEEDDEGDVEVQTLQEIIQNELKSEIQKEVQKAITEATGKIF